MNTHDCCNLLQLLRPQAAEPSHRGAVLCAGLGADAAKPTELTQYGANVAAVSYGVGGAADWTAELPVSMGIRLLDVVQLREALDADRVLARREAGDFARGE